MRGSARSDQRVTRAMAGASAQPSMDSVYVRANLGPQAGNHALGREIPRRAVRERMRVSWRACRRPLVAGRGLPCVEYSARRWHLGDGNHRQRDRRRAAAGTEAGARLIRVRLRRVMTAGILMSFPGRHPHAVHRVPLMHRTRLQHRLDDDRAEPECPEARKEPQQGGTSHGITLPRSLRRRE